MKWRVINLTWMTLSLAAAGCGAGDAAGSVEGGIDAPAFFADTGSNLDPDASDASDASSDASGVKDVLVGPAVDVGEVGDAQGDVADSEDDADAGGGIVILPPELDVASADGDATAPDGGDEVDSGPAPECMTDEQCPATEPCFDSVCYEGACLKVMNSAPCDDGDGCTVDDVCSQGTCTGAPMGSCSDDDPCTVNDVCVDGGCEGTPMDCDDENDCSTDVCYQGECKHLVVDVPECKLGIEIFSPDRAETIISFAPVTVTGKLASPAGPAELTLNGEDVGVAPNGTFSHVVSARTGINIMTIEAVDSFEQTARLVQAFAYGPEVVAPGSFAGPIPVNGGIMAWLDREVFDDDASDVDDLATLVETVIEDFDLNAALPDPLLEDDERPSFLLCTWDVAVTDLSIDLDEVDLYPVVDGLVLKIRFSDLYAWVAATAGGLCPDAIGSATSDAITVTAELSVDIDTDGVQVELALIDVDIDEIELDIQEGVGQLFDWLINWFEDDLTDLVKSELEGQVSNIVAPLLGGVIEQFANFTFDFDLPAIPPNTQPLPMRLAVSPSDALLTPNGLELELSGGFGTQKGILHTSPGSVAGGCVGVQDVPGASCLGACGGKSSAGCWCDTLCSENEDCCGDYLPICVDPPADKLGVCCEATDGAGCGADQACQACVCAADEYCCDTLWDSICVNVAGGACDGTCKCTELCCESGAEAGCPGYDCVDCICDLDPYCCDTQWDSLCVSKAEDACAKSCGCYSGTSVLPGSPLPHAQPVELLAFEAVINRFFFAIWWGGHTVVDVDSEQLAATVGDLGLPGLALTVDPHLPPIVTGCTATGAHELQLGDVLMTAYLDLGGQLQSVTFFASARVVANLSLVETDDGLHTAAIEIGEVIETAAQLVDTAGGSPLLNNIDHTFIEAALSELFIGELLTGVTTTLPTRVIDLGEWVPGLPMGSNVAFDPTELDVLGAALTLGGEIVSVP